MTEPIARRRAWRRAAQVLLIAVVVGFLAWMVGSRWADVRDVIADLTPGAVAASLLLALIAVWCTFMSWRVILADFGHRVPVTGGLKIFFVGQLAKYLPGKVWPVLTQMRLGRAHDVPGRSSAAAVLIMVLMLLGAAALVTACTLPVLGRDAAAAYWWVLLVLPVVAVGLWPRVLNSTLAWIMRRLKQEPMPAPLTGGTIVRSAAWSILALTLWGGHLWILLTDLGAGGAGLPVRAVGAFAASWAIGFLLLVTPAGAGPREVALVVLLAPAVGEPIALVAAVVSRLLMTAADLIWPGVSMLGERRSRRRAAAAVSADASWRP